MEEERTITLDLGSSPDPLIDPVLSPPMMPPSHIKKKTQAAERLFTVLAPSPRKQTFELDVGHEGSPQRLLVTVEAGDEGSRSTSRRLFQSPTPKRRVTPRRETTVTTTTVPLRGLSDDEGPGPTNATPGRRGRPRKSGTPITTRRKRPGTPARSRKTPARTSVSPQKDILTSDIGFDTTPRPSSQPRRVAKRKATSPAKEDGAPGSQPRKRGRPRKQTMKADDAARLEQENTPKPEARHSGAIAPAQGNQPGHDLDDDIWLATMSDQPTPVAPRQRRPYDTDHTASHHRASEPEPQLPRHEPEHQEHYDWPDLGGGADSYSDAGSLASEQNSDKEFEDTVAAEEFTMISIGSLPSMQPNSSVMAPAQEDIGEATSMIINGALESLRQSQNRQAEQASVQPAPAEPQPSVAGAAEQNTEQEHQRPQFPPPSSPQRRRQSPRRTKAQPLARHLAEKSLQQEDRQPPAPVQPPADPEPQEASTYDDSFSEIPEAVLAAATPRRYRQPPPPAEEPHEDIQPSIERPSRVNHSNPQSETNRLLTPDETPSPIQSDTEDHNPQTNLSSDAPRINLPLSRPSRSPQNLNAAVAQHIRRNSTETPADQLLSFTSSNVGGRDPQPLQLPIPDPQRRPTLSPIVRAGRALQIITSDPPSPPGRDSVLGSPFRGSVPKSSQSPVPMPPPAPAARATRSPSQPRVNAVTQSPSRSWLAPLSQVKEFIVRSAQSLSPSRVSVSGTERMDDPFGPDPSELTGSGSVRNTLFSGPNRQSHDRDATVSVAGSEGARSAHDDDAMSWQGEGSPAGGSQRSASPQMEVFDSRRSSGNDRIEYQPVSARAPEARNAEVREQPETREEHRPMEEEEEEEDDDIWAIEAQRPTPYAPRHAPARVELQPAPPRRSKISSPWRQNSRHLNYSDEVEQNSDNEAHSGRNNPAVEEEPPRAVPQDRERQVPVRFERNAPTNEEEEFSLLSQNRPRQAPAPSNPPTKKPDLSAFFSSPAVLPDMGQPPLTSRKREEGPAAPKPRTVPVQRPTSSGNSLFAQYLQPQSQTQLPSVPQKHLEIGGRRRSVDLFSPVRKSAERSSPEQPAASVQHSNPREMPEARPAYIPHEEDFAPDRRQSINSETAAAPVPRAATPESEQDIRPPHIPQKMNFTPRQDRSNSTLFQPKPIVPRTSLFGNSQVSAFFSAVRPQPQRPPALPREEEKYEEEELSLIQPSLKPLPDRAASPAKSSMRSPLKPKTPGRVVEFASSTLSPLGQAQARAERRESMSPEKEDDTRLGFGRGNVVNGDAEGDRENPSEPPSPSPSPSPSLSPSPSPSPSPSHEQQQRQLGRFNSRHLGSSTTTSSSITIPQQKQQQQQQQQPQELSPTTWTRAHWLRLDELLQARKRGTLQLQLETARHHRHRPLSASLSARPSSGGSSSNRINCRHLLGKMVTSQGESMALQGWHLDVVEAFLSEVDDGGTVAWDGAEIAKRVFALIVGEERRRLGMVPARR